MKNLKTLIAGALLITGSSAFAAPYSFDCTDCPQGIGPDGGTTTTSTLTVGDTATINSLELFVDATHTFSGDLDIFLAHGGTSVHLHDSTGGGDDYVPTTYSITDFDGMDLAGDWILTIVDNLFADAGTLSNWTISGDATYPTTGVAEPGILALFGIGVAGLALRRRRF